MSALDHGARRDYLPGARPMLGRHEQLYDIESVERFCSAIVTKHLDRTGARLSYHQRRDLLDFLLVQLYGMAARFDSDLNDSFDGYAQKYLPLRVSDWYREEFGDSRWGNARNDAISLDHYTENIHPNSINGDTYRRDGLAALIDHETDHVIAHADDRIARHAIVDRFRELSEEARWIIDNVVRPKAEGATRDELATALGVSKNKIDRYIGQVRRELEELLGLEALAFLDADADVAVAA